MHKPTGREGAVHNVGGLCEQLQRPPGARGAAQWEGHLVHRTQPTVNSLREVQDVAGQVEGAGGSASQRAELPT